MGLSEKLITAIEKAVRDLFFVLGVLCQFFEACITTTMGKVDKKGGQWVHKTSPTESRECNYDLNAPIRPMKNVRKIPFSTVHQR